MPKFRRVARTTVEAERYEGPACVGWDDPLPPAPPGVRWKSLDITWDRYPVVVTKQGHTVHVRPGDYVIREIDGSGYYPCDPDIFAAAYEPVDEGE